MNRCSHKHLLWRVNFHLKTNSMSNGGTGGGGGWGFGDLSKPNSGINSVIEGHLFSWIHRDETGFSSCNPFSWPTSLFCYKYAYLFYKKPRILASTALKVFLNYQILSTQSFLRVSYRFHYNLHVYCLCPHDAGSKWIWDKNMFKFFL